MKWSWKSFGLQLGASAALGLGLAVLISMIIDANRGPGAADSTLLSLAIGGCIAPILLAFVSGWKGWGLKPLLVAGAIVASLYSSRLGAGIVVLAFTSLVYLAAHKIRTAVFYYFSKGGSEAPNSDPKL